MSQRTGRKLGALRQFDAKVGQAAARANNLATARTGRVGGIP